MKKCVSIYYDEDKYLALEMYAQQKGSSVAEELAQAMDGLYQKVVPANVRAFLDMKEKGQKAKKRSSTASDDSSAVMEAGH